MTAGAGARRTLGREEQGIRQRGPFARAGAGCNCRDLQLGNRERPPRWSGATVGGGGRLQRKRGRRPVPRGRMIALTCRRQGAGASFTDEGGGAARVCVEAGYLVLTGQ